MLCIAEAAASGCTRLRNRGDRTTAGANREEVSVGELRCLEALMSLLFVISWRGVLALHVEKSRIRCGVRERNPCDDPTLETGEEWGPMGDVRIGWARLELVIEVVVLLVETLWHVSMDAMLCAALLTALRVQYLLCYSRGNAPCCIVV